MSQKNISFRTVRLSLLKYLSNPADAKDPLISLVDANLSGLPPTTIINAEIDPLRSEGEELAQRMGTAGVPVEQQTFRGVTHEFFGMASVLEQAVRAQDFAVRRLQDTFARESTTPTYYSN